MKSIPLLGILPDHVARRRASKKFRGKLAQNPIFELQLLERRVLLDASPAIATDSTTVYAGYPMSISLNANESNSDIPIDHWVINWGDSSGTQEVDGNPSAVSHTYAALGPHTIHAQVTEGTFVENGDGSTDGDDDDNGGTGDGTGGTGDGTGGTGDEDGDDSTSIGGGTFDVNVDIDVNVVSPIPIPSIDGAFQVSAGGNYALSLLDSNPNGLIDSWQINWGDGSAPQNVSGNPSSVNHVFTVPSDTDLITASATLGSDQFPAGTLPVVVRLGNISNPPATNLVVNFQPAYGSVAGVHYVDGTLPDAGHVFTDQANFWGATSGFAYGWSTNVTDSKYVTSGSNIGPDFRYQTYTPMDPGGLSRTWTIGLAPGDYNVRVVAGASDFAGNSGSTAYSINANGTPVITDFVPATGNWYTDETAKITVGSDGRLTLSNGEYASNNVIDFVQITPYADAAIAPAAPSALSVGAEAQSGSSVPINLNWTDNSDNEDGFKIYRSTNNSTFTLVQTTAPDVTFWSDSVSPNTTYYYKVAATNATADSATTGSVSVYTGGLNVSDAPYLGSAWPVPGRIEAENFDIGSAGSSDSESQNIGGSYRNSAVDIGPAGPTEGGRMVGWTAAEESLSYTVNVASAGAYRMDVAVASAGTGGSFHLKIDGSTVSNSTFNIPDTGGWTRFQTISLEGLSLSANNHVITLVLDSNGLSGLVGNFDYLQFTAMSAAGPSAPKNLYASPAAAAQVAIQWTNTSIHAASFLVQRSADGQNFTTIATVSPTVTTYIDTTATANTAYAYRLLGHNSKGDSPSSNLAIVTTGGSSGAAITATYDAYGNSTSWHGASSQLDVQNGANTAYLQFNTAGITGAINSATLWLFGNEQGATQPGVVATLGGITNNSWDEGAGDGPPSGTVSDLVANTLNLATGRWFQFDVSAFLLSQLSSGISHITLSLSSLTNTIAPWLFDSRENASATPSGPQPILIVNRIPPPTAPTLNTVSTISTSQLNLSWSFSGSGDGFYIERSTNGSSFTTIATVYGTSADTYSDTGLTAGTVYYYRVRAYGTGYGETGYSATQSAITTTAAPTITAATGISSSQINLAWADGAGTLTGVQVQRSSDGTTYSMIATILGGAMTFSDTGLSANTGYDYRLFAQGPGGNSAYSNVQYAATAVAAPGIPSLSTPALDPATPSTAVDLAWTSGGGSATSYFLERSLDNSTFTAFQPLSVAYTTFVDTTLSAATTYYYRIRAYGLGGYSAYSASQSITTALAAPTGLVAYYASPTQMDLFWVLGGSETNIYIERSTNGGTTFSRIATISGASTSYQDTGLTPATPYVYRVQAHGGAPDSPYSSIATATTSTDAPTSLIATAVSSNEIDLSWANGSGGRTGNLLQRSPDGLNWSTTTLDPAISIYHDTTVFGGSSYYYRVQSCDGSVASAYTAIVVASTNLLAPSGLAASRDVNAPESKVDLSWTSGGGNVAGVSVERSIDGTHFYPIARVSATTAGYLDVSRSSDTSYWYRIQAIGTGGKSGYSAIASTVTGPSIPFGLAAVGMSAGEVDLSWTVADENEGGILIQRSANATTGFAQIASLAGTPSTYFDTDTTLSASTTYYYKICAYGVGSGNNSAYTDVVAAATTAAAPGAPSSLSATAASSSEIDLNWSSGSGAAAGIYIERSADDVTFTRVANLIGTPTADQDTGLAPGTTYYYRVRSWGAGGFSSYSSVVSAVTGASLGSTSTSTSGLRIAGVTDNLVMLAWNPPANLSGIASYQIQRNSTTIANTPLGIFFDAALSPGTTYTYTVTAQDSSGNDLSFTATANATTSGAPAFDGTPPSAPAIASAASTAESITLTWSAASDASTPITYEILRNGQSVGETTSTTFADKALDSFTTYQYIIRAVDSSDNVSASTPAYYATNTSSDNQPPSAPRELAQTAATSSSISLSWLASSDNVAVTGYKVLRGGAVISSLITGTTYTDSGLSNGSYTYTVEALDAAGNFDVSNPLVASTDTTAPLDSGADQYIPPALESEFYGQVLPVFRAQWVRANPSPGLGVASPPAAAGWLDLAPYSSSPDTTFVDGSTGGVQLASNVYFIDANHNGIFDAGESAWIAHNPTSWDNTYSPAATLLSGSAPAVGASGIGGVYYADFNGNGQVDSGELLPGNAYLIQAASGSGAASYCYRDATGVGHWIAGDSIWLDANDNRQFDPGDGDTLIYGPTPDTGAWGKSNGLAYHDFGDSSHRVVWVDSTGFRQDFAALYGALDSLVPHFALASDPTTPAAVGALLGDDVPQTVSNGVSMSFTAPATSTYTVTAATGNFGSVLPGDSIDINGIWYQISGGWGSASTSLTLATAYKFASGATSDSASSYELANWTLVPTLAANSTTGTPAFSYVRGIPDQNSIYFKQQFDEVASVIGQLVGMKLYQDPTQVYTKALSDKIYSVANAVLDEYVPVFGDSATSLHGPAARQLEIELQTHVYDPGAPILSDVAATMENMLHTLAGSIYITGGATPWPTFIGHEASYIFSNFGTSKEDDQLTQVSNYAAAITANGLWLYDAPLGMTSGSGDGQPMLIDSSAPDPHADAYQSEVLDPAGPTMDDLPFEAPTSEQPLWSPYSIPQQFVVGNEYLSLDNDPSALVHYVADGQVGPAFGAGMFYTGYSYTLSAPGPANALGGDAMIQSLLSATPTNYTGTPLDFGQSTTISYAQSDIHGWLTNLYAQVQSPAGAAVSGNSWVLQGELINGSEDLGISYFATKEVDDPLNTLTHVLLRWNPNDPTMYGRVAERSFTYAGTDPNSNLPSPQTFDAAPYVPPTSQMDYQNVVPDSNLDGIVQSSHDQNTFGQDTGSMSFAMLQGMPQVFIPLNTDNTDSANASALPIEAYLQQGAFGSSDSAIGSLGNDYLTYADADQNGLSLAYSLDTRVRTNLLIENAANHIKRVEVVRPGGNSVVFNFNWNSTTGQFDPIGVPASYNGRDSRMLYVLRDLTAGVDTDLSYQMEFSSGITQTFDAATGKLQSVADENSGLSATVTPGLATGPDGNPAQVDSPRYNIDLEFANGKLDHVNYATTGDSSDTIKTQLSYNSSGSIIALGKTDVNTDAAIAPFSYTVNSDGSISTGGITYYRTDDGSNTFDIETDAGDNNSYLDDRQVFNGNNLISSDTIILSENGTTSTSATTGYTYNTSTPGGLTYASGRYVNGIAAWGQVTLVTNADDSWEAYSYDSTTGWLTDDYMPYKNSASTSLSSGQDEHYSYDASVSGNGDIADPMAFVAQPRETTDSIAGTTTDVSFARYSTEPATTSAPMQILVATRSGATSTATWGSSVFNTTTAIAGDTITETGPDGTTTITDNGGESLSTTKFNGNTISTDNSYFNAFGGLGDPTDKGTDQSTGVGQEPDTTIPGPDDAFGRPESQTQDGIKSTYEGYGWFGPTTVVGADGSDTVYTFTDDGRIRSENDPNGVTTTYDYDAAGNVVHTMVTSDDPVTGETSQTDTYATFDAQGRQTSSTDAMGNVTYYAFSSGSSGTTETTSFKASGASSATTIDTTVSDLDGTQTSDSGSSVQNPSTGDEGVVTTATTIGGVTVPAGSTWTQTFTNGTNDWTKTYYNLLGQQIASQQTSFGAGGSVLDSSASTYDGNGRVIMEVAADGTITHYDYDPNTGELADTWTDVNGDGTFTVGTDDRQRTILSPMTSNDASYVGSTDDSDSTDGEQSDFSGSKNGGLDTRSVSDGEVTTTHTAIGTGGNDTVTATNPDGSTTVDQYDDGGTLTEEDNYDADDTLIGKTVYGYDDLGRNTTVTQYQGSSLTTGETTTYDYDADGNVIETHNPDGTTDSQTIDPLTGEPTSITTPDGTEAQGVDSQGNITSQSGGGAIPATYDYNSQGQVTYMHLFPSGSTSDSTGEETTHYIYDPYTGMLSRKEFGYNPSDGSNVYAENFNYDAQGRLYETSRPGQEVDSFVYDAAGQLHQRISHDHSGTASDGQTFTDTYGYDDQGRTTNLGEVQADSSGNPLFAVVNGFTYDPIFGQLASESQVAGTSTNYHYFGPQDNQAGQQPGALKDLAISQNGVTLGTRTYTYDDAGRIQTMTVDGTVTYTYSYVGGTDTIAGTAVSYAGVSGNTITSTNTYNSANQLSGITTTAGSTSLYSASYTYYSNGQRNTESVNALQSDNSTVDSHGWTYGYDGQQQLTSVTNTSDSSSVNSYSYDAVGNRIDSSLGAPNAINDYANFSYNAQGDLLDDGTNTYTWDAKDRLTSITPDDPTSGKPQEFFRYDAQDRLVEKDSAYYEGSGNWSTPSVLLQFVYDGSQLVQILNNQNKTQFGYVWGPDGKLAGFVSYSWGQPSAYYVAQTDASGNLQQLINAQTGAVAMSVRMDAYGNILSYTGSLGLLRNVGFVFANMWRDPDSGLCRAGVRWYEPPIGRWISPDPSEEQGGLAMNPYCMNDPVNNIDPSGLDSIPVQVMPSAVQSYNPVPGLSPSGGGVDYFSAGGAALTVVGAGAEYLYDNSPAFHDAVNHAQNWAPFQAERAADQWLVEKERSLASKIPSIPEKYTSRDQNGTTLNYSALFHALGEKLGIVKSSPAPTAASPAPAAPPPVSAGQGGGSSLPPKAPPSSEGPSTQPSDEGVGGTPPEGVAINAKAWQEYEQAIRARYGAAAFKSRQFTAVVDGKLVDAVADNVVKLGGKDVAIEAKFVDNWATSLRNPASPIGREPFAVAEQSQMVQQAKAYSQAFSKVIYHSNSKELIDYYSKVFASNGITNVEFVYTP